MSSQLDARTHWVRAFIASLRLPDALDPGCTADALDPGFHGVRTRWIRVARRTHWIRGFITFQLARRTRTVMLMAPVCP